MPSVSLTILPCYWHTTAVSPGGFTSQNVNAVLCPIPWCAHDRTARTLVKESGGYASASSTARYPPNLLRFVSLLYSITFVLRETSVDLIYFSWFGYHLLRNEIHQSEQSICCISVIRQINRAGMYGIITNHPYTIRVFWDLSG